MSATKGYLIFEDKDWNSLYLYLRCIIMVKPFYLLVTWHIIVIIILVILTLKLILLIIEEIIIKIIHLSTSFHFFKGGLLPKSSQCRIFSYHKMCLQHTLIFIWNCTLRTALYPRSELRWENAINHFLSTAKSLLSIKF